MIYRLSIHCDRCDVLGATIAHKGKEPRNVITMLHTKLMQMGWKIYNPRRNTFRYALCGECKEHAEEFLESQNHSYVGVLG